MSSPKRPDGQFSPVLVSSPNVRAKVKSSGYGSVTPVKKESESVIRLRQEKEEADLKHTFKPDTVATAKARQKAASSGYGLAIAPARALAEGEKYRFKPDESVTSKTVKANKVATSSGYGKNLPARKSKVVDPDAPTFKPKLDFSKKGERMRKTTQSRHQETSRPKTAPARIDRSNQPLMYTLAADRSEKKPEDFSSDFDLTGFSLSAFPLGQGNSPIGKFAEPIQHSSVGKKLLTSSCASGYGSTWSPTVNLVEKPQSMPTIKAGIAGSTYIANSNDIPVVKSKQMVVTSNYGKDYGPTIAPLAAVTPPPKTYFPSRNFVAAGMQELSAPDNSKVNSKVRANYGRDYIPPRSAPPAPKPQDEHPPFKTSRSVGKLLIPSLTDVPIIKHDIDHVASSGYGIVSPLAPDYDPRHITPLSKRQDSFDMDEQTTIL